MLNQDENNTPTHGRQKATKKAGPPNEEISETDEDRNHEKGETQRAHDPTKKTGTV